MMVKSWAKVVHHPHYRVSDEGDVVNVRSKKLLAPTPGKDGYIRVSLVADGIKHTYGVHQLVAEAFIPNPNSKPIANHKNGVRGDNSVGNLEWVTSSENAARRVFPAKTKRGRAIVQLLLDSDDIVDIWPSLRAAAASCGVTDGAIASCCKGRSASSAGYRWVYREDFEEPNLAEEWRPLTIAGTTIVGVSTLGNIKYRSGKVTQGSICTGGRYYQVASQYVHRLVASAFLHREQDKDVVDHKNEDPTDNRVENLEWVTKGENNRRAIANRILKEAPGTRVAYPENSTHLIYSIPDDDPIWVELGLD